MPEAMSEIDRNHEEFRRELPRLIALHPNKFALMRHGKIVNIYSTWPDAYSTAKVFFSDNEFSIQKITDIPVDLGFFSHAVPVR